MNFRQFKRKLKTEQYNIPNVLSKIKDNLPEISIKNAPSERQKPKFRYSLTFATLILTLLFVFSAMSNPLPNNEVSGPVNLSHFNSNAEIDNTVKKFNRQKEAYIEKEALLFENYYMGDIPDLPDSRFYGSNNQVAKLYKNRVFYLNSQGLVVFDTSNNDLTQIYQKDLDFDNTTHVKTLEIVNDKLIVIYKNQEYVNVLIFDTNVIYQQFVYKIKSTYVNSHIHNNKLYLVTILNERILPTIEVNNLRKQITPTDIGYLDNVVGESYTILTSIDLATRQHSETIFLSFNKWDIIHFKDDNLYLINNHMNYKRNLQYGEYTTVVKFKDVAREGFTYQGSYSVQGSVVDKSNVYEYEDNLRIALQVTHYNVRKILFFFTKITEIEHSINIVNLKSTVVDGKPILELTNNFEIRESDELDKSISILTTKFYNEKVMIESKGNEINVDFLDLTDPFNIIKIEETSVEKDWYKSKGDIIALDSTFGFEIRTIKTSTGEFEIRFYDLTGSSPVELKEHYAYLNYSYLLADSDYIIIEAIRYSNSLYISSDENNYYIGFSVVNNLYKTYLNNNKGTPVGTYTLIKVSKEDKQTKFQDLTTNNTIIEKLVGSASNQIYGLSHDKIVKLKHNDFGNFVITQLHSINDMKTK